MKKSGISFLLFLLFSLQLYAQQAGSDFASPVSLQSSIQFGLTFVNGLCGLLFLMLFLFYPSQRMHLFFGLFNIFLVLTFLNDQFLNASNKSAIIKTYSSYAEGFLSRLVGASILLFMLHALNRMKPFVWWFVVFLFFVDFPLSIILSHLYDPINNAVRAAFTLFCLWIALFAFRSKNKEDWLVGFLALAVVSINLSFVLLPFTGVDITSFTTTWIPFVIAVSAVVYLSLRYARANTSLEHQLVEVRRLSEQNLLREGEKQQILSSQKETLEQQVTIRTAELNYQKKELQKTLEELKSTQSQLIQSEKMASLGELTAGIAHEIQNPLNFVNNFSEVNKELIAEMKHEIDKGDIEEVKAIANDIEENEVKINHHGKRADAIVKGMLQHSQRSTGQKEPTNINTLTDEYLRLSYQGLRAKDKSFNAAIETDFDESIGKIEVVPQDIGRVLLNLFNNAFYAVAEKKKKLDGTFEPAVSVSTKKSGDKVNIIVRDNGFGVPEKAVHKIFQPFFTTKPTGQGTGLGLSLSYDIIKAHAGEIKVESNEGEGSEFIIQLPISQ